MSLDNKINTSNYINMLAGLTGVSLAMALGFNTIAGLLDYRHSIKEKTLKEISKQNPELKIDISNYIDKDKRDSKFFLICGVTSGIIALGLISPAYYLKKQREYKYLEDQKEDN